MADNNIIVKITGDADLTDAQMQLRELTNRGKDLEAEMQRLEAAEKADIANISAWIKDAKRRDEEIKKTTASYQQQKRAIIESMNSNEKSIVSLKKNVSTMNAMQGVGNKLTQQIRAIREQLSQMEMAGDTTSQTFIDLSVEAARLTDQMGDTQQQINILASDTANLDAAMSLGSGLVGTFNVATSAMALLGGESEELQEAFLKVQAAMAILNGVQSVANTLNKDSAANVVIRTALQKLFNKEKAKETALTTSGVAAAGADAAAKGVEATATGAATTAQWSLNAAMLANPAMVIVAAVAALVAGLAIFIGQSKKAKEAQRDFNGEMERTKTALKESEDATAYAAQLAEAEGKSWKEIAKIEEKGLADQTNAAARAYNDMLAKKKAANGRISEEEQKTMDEMLELYKSKKEEFEKHRQSTHIKEIAETTKNNEEKLQKEREYQQKRREEIKNAEDQLLDVRIALMADGADKEIAKINLDYDRKIAAIKGNSKAEIALRKALEEQRSQEIQKVNDELAQAEREQQNELAQLRLQNYIALAETFGGEYLYETRKEVLEKQAELEIANIESSEQNAQLRAEKILAVEMQLKTDLTALEKEHSASAIEEARMTAEIKLKEQENAALAIINSENSTDEQIKAAQQSLYDHEKNLRQIEMEELNAKHAAGLISEQEFQDAKLDIERAALDEEAEMISQHAENTREIVSMVLDTAGELMDTIFTAFNDNIQAQLDELDDLYTTDAEEAKEDASKKYISEKELEDKKMALQLRAARAAKAQAILNIGLQTAQAIIASLASAPLAVGVGPNPVGIASLALVTATGAAQLAAAIAKPISQYAKGRKGGKGEFAMVGERGAELMYVPEGASIVPHDKLGNPELWGQYGIPKGIMPTMPNVDTTAMQEYATQQSGFALDYERLGRVVAKNIPAQKAVNVSIDRDGINVTEGHETHTILNHKYEAAWI